MIQADRKGRRVKGSALGAATFPLGRMGLMNALVDARREEMSRLCQRHHVRRLELFGSAAAMHFDAARSDLDFLVDFLPLGPEERSEAYFGLLEALQDLFKRPVDLVEIGAIHNPYFQTTVDRSRVLLYAA